MKLTRLILLLLLPVSLIVCSCQPSQKPKEKRPEFTYEQEFGYCIKNFEKERKSFDTVITLLPNWNNDPGNISYQEYKDVFFDMSSDYSKHIIPEGVLLLARDDDQERALFKMNGWYEHSASYNNWIGGKWENGVMFKDTTGLIHHSLINGDSYNIMNPKLYTENCTEYWFFQPIEGNWFAYRHYISDL